MDPTNKTEPEADAAMHVHAASSAGTIVAVDNDDVTSNSSRDGLLPARNHHHHHHHHHHHEPHFEHSDVLRDILIGLSDGLTVPFALAAGLAALGNSRLVVLAGLAEIVAGAISMGMGGYLAGLSEIEHYDAERLREVREVETVPWHEEEEIYEIFEPYGIERSNVTPLVEALKKDKDVWVDFMMKFELNLEKPDKSRTWISAITIGGAYLVGGLIPLIPYMLISAAQTALYFSFGFTVFTLLVFGYFKARIVGTKHPVWSAFQMALIGIIASSAAYGIAKAIPLEH